MSKFLKGWVAMLTMVAVAALAQTACKKKPTCDVTAKYSDAAASKLSAVLNCKAPAAMSADFNSELQKLNLCSGELPTGPIASLVCAPLAKMIGSYAAGKVPAAWQCDPSAVIGAGEAALIAACSAAPW